MYKKRYILALLLLIFIFPLAGSVVLYYYHDSFSFNTVNHGTLVVPPHPVHSPLPAMYSRQWQIVFITGGPCDTDCKLIAHSLQQMIKVLGKDADRVAFAQVNHWSSLQAKQIYLIDPQTNLFMYYPSNTNPIHILKDLKRVLEVSQIG